MKYILIILISISTFSNTLVFFGDDRYEPFSYWEDNQLKGIDVDIVRELDKRIEDDIEIKLVPWNRLIEFTKIGKVDGSFSLFKNDEREGFAIYTIIPHRYSSFKFYIRKNFDYTYRNLDDLEGQKLGLNKSFFINDEFSSKTKEGYFYLEETENVSTGINLLLNNRIDFYLGNAAVVDFYLRKNSLTDKVISIEPAVIEKKAAYIVISKLGSIGEDEDTIEEINKALMELKVEGVLDEIWNRYNGTTP